MCRSHSVAKQRWKQISARCGPLGELEMVDERACESTNVNHLDECRTSSLHSPHKETIPPYSTPSITLQPLIRTSYDQHGHGDYDGYKQAE